MGGRGGMVRYTSILFFLPLTLENGVGYKSGDGETSVHTAQWQYTCLSVQHPCSEKAMEASLWEMGCGCWPLLSLPLPSMSDALGRHVNSLESWTESHCQPTGKGQNTSFHWKGEGLWRPCDQHWVGLAWAKLHYQHPLNPLHPVLYECNKIKRHGLHAIFY